MWALASSLASLRPRRKKIKMDAGTRTHQILFASILRSVVAWYSLPGQATGEENAYIGILLPSLYIVKCRLDRERDSGNLQHAIHLVKFLFKGLNARFNHFFTDMDALMATALHPHYTLVVLKNIAPDNVATVKEKHENELKTAIM